MSDLVGSARFTDLPYDPGIIQVAVLNQNGMNPTAGGGSRKSRCRSFTGHIRYLSVLIVRTRMLLRGVPSGPRTLNSE